MSQVLYNSVVSSQFILQSFCLHQSSCLRQSKLVWSIMTKATENRTVNLPCHCYCTEIWIFVPSSILLKAVLRIYIPLSVSSSQPKTAWDGSVWYLFYTAFTEHGIIVRRRDERRRRWCVVLCDEAKEDSCDDIWRREKEGEKEKENLTIYNRWRMDAIA